MNPHSNQPVSFRSLLKSLWQHRDLIITMTKRDVAGRYRGSVLGLFWSFLNPVFMLLVYTFVFSVVFNARWGVTEEETSTQFAVVLFAGLVVHSFFAEVLSKAPGLILGSSNYVKKVVFPLEILPAIALGGAIFHTAISLLVLQVAYLFFTGIPPWTIVLTPFVFFPLAILSLGLAWMLAALGVFLRDIGQFIGVIITVLLFLSPIFFPIDRLPEEYQILILLNPLTFIIEQAREVLIWGRLPDWTGLAIYTFFSTVFAWAGYAWFQKTRKGFADVL
ncbi:lipopolysaccharide transport system permease protein [Vreelandella songnenensis]|uniref:Transport permease protein n=1 Tax=Vreelandella songnenensis TaxID=1176243 RepID=A0A2T0V836_9GAMM|nr:ABC transporter permease [Halomonas songnenensis]PRY66352.1 lipopolysaccharide transport system permease protein [Halomonas songnenensis]